MIQKLPVLYFCIFIIISSNSKRLREDRIEEHQFSLFSLSPKVGKKDRKESPYKILDIKIQLEDGRQLTDQGRLVPRNIALVSSFPWDILVPDIIWSLKGVFHTNLDVQKLLSNHSCLVFYYLLFRNFFYSFSYPFLFNGYPEILFPFLIRKKPTDLRSRSAPLDSKKEESTRSC